MATAQQLRGTGEVVVGCTIPPKRTPSNLPDDATAPQLTIYGLGPTSLQSIEQNNHFLGWLSCGVDGDSFECNSPTLSAGKTNQDALGGIFEGFFELSCISSTPEINAENNRAFFPSVLASVSSAEGTVLITSRGAK